MSSRFNQFIGILGVLAILLANSALSFAEKDFEEVKTAVAGKIVAEGEIGKPEAGAEEKQPAAEPFEDKDVKPQDKDQFLSRVKQELNLTKTDYKQLLNSISDTKKRLELITEEKMSLQDQLTNLDQNIAITSEKLLSVIKQVIEKENKIALLYEQIEIREVALEYQKELLKDYMRLIYQEEDKLLSVNEDGSIDAFKMLLTEDSVGDNLRKWEYFDLLNEAGQQMVERIDNVAKQLEKERAELEETKAKLEELKVELQKEKEEMLLQKEAKKQILRITLGQEEVYRQLLEQTIEQQEQLISDIKNLSNALGFIEAKVAEEGDAFDIEKYKDILDADAKVLYNYHISTLGTTTDQFVWPVEPKRGISAYFRDPSYVGVFGVQHNAVDIPAYQGSPVRSAAEGVVYKVRDNGYGYSYIIVAHSGNLMTVYGHLSNLLVEEGQKVTNGSIIGLSGGMPGTKGAGYMTTGPHLHFETLLDGKYVDPLNYLPLTVLTVDQMERLPERHKKSWEEQFMSAAREKISREED